ncbi:MAG: oligoendopeptidase F [Spirochaetales bacterium]
MATNVPTRADVPAEHRWNLHKLYENDEAWEEGLKKLEAMIPRVGEFKGKLGDSADQLHKTIEFYEESSMLSERLAYYAHLRQTENEGDSEARGRMSRFMMTATQMEGEWSWFEPELQRIPSDRIDTWIDEERFADYRIFVQKLLRFKPHVLSEAEERLLALQSESAQVANDSFSVLTNVDLDFGEVDTPEGKKPLTQSSFASFMQHQDRDVRKRAYHQLYNVYESHKTTLAQLYSGSCQLDKYRAQVRNYESSRERALFPDNVPVSVYDNLVGTINKNLPSLHHYYDVRKRALGVDELRHYDVYVPLVGQAKSEHTYEEAVDLITAALAPLGAEYVDVLRGGLLGDWVDRYENKGKRSGAFSAGSFFGDPYILMNYKPDVLRHIFTLAHEGGHSMHSHYSAASNPFLQYNYTIFEAEVASTFNEQLLFNYMLENAESRELKTYLVNSRVDDILATLFRQTMFAEFEQLTHESLESGTPLTVDFLRGEYRKLLEKYFGSVMKFEETSDMEGLRIPHFYRAFYVYKYATGVSASIALAKRVTEGGQKEREDYYAFLRSGGSRFPIDSLKVAGVDMSEPGPVEAACGEFARLVAELEELLAV